MKPNFESQQDFGRHYPDVNFDHAGSSVAGYEPRRDVLRNVGKANCRPQQDD